MARPAAASAKPQRRRGRPGLAAAAAVALLGCGALDDSAPPTPPRSHCASVDERLAPLVELAKQGKTAHLAGLLSTRLDPASQRAVVQLVLDVAYALPPDTSKNLPQLLAPQGLGALVPLVVAIFEPLPGDPSAVPPVPPRIAEMSAFASTAQNCLSSELFVLGSRLFRDPKAATALDGLLEAGPAGAQQLLNALKSAGVEGRSSFQVVIRSLATSLAQDGFDAAPLLQTLKQLRDPKQPGVIDALAGLLQVAVLGDSAADKEQARGALQGFAKCLIIQDPAQLIAGHGYDVLITMDPQAIAAVDLDSQKWLPVVAYATDVLATKPAARDAWNQLLGLVLRPDVATEALPELINLLNSQALPGALALLGDLVTQPCKQAKP